MPTSPDFADAVITRLAAYGATEAKRMFGGFGIFVDGLMIGLISGDGFYLKVDDGNRADFVEAGMQPFSYLRRGKRAELSYWRVPGPVFDDPLALADWAAKAHEAARAARARRARPKRR